MNFSLKMFLTILFLFFGMPVVNHILFENVVFPDFEGSMGITKFAFGALCFLFCGKVFQYILFGSALLAALFNRPFREPRSREEMIKMEKSSRMNLIILPAGFLFGFVWGAVMGLFSKQLGMFEAAWALGLYGLGYSLLLLLLVKLSFISMFAFAKFDDL